MTPQLSCYYTSIGLTTKVNNVSNESLTEILAKKKAAAMRSTENMCYSHRSPFNFEDNITKKGYLETPKGHIETE